MKGQLTASIVFSSMSVFDMLRDQLHMIFWVINQSVTGKVSLDRVDDFLKNVSLQFICSFGVLIEPLSD
jgi:small-conductance mechanosensitive channel